MYVKLKQKNTRQNWTEDNEKLIQSAIMGWGYRKAIKNRKKLEL